MSVGRSLYDALPYVYIVAGLIAWVFLEARYSLMPALLLIGVGLIVLVWRRAAKRLEAARQRNRQQRQAAKLRGG